MYFITIYPNDGTGQLQFQFQSFAAAMDFVHVAIERFIGSRLTIKIEKEVFE